MKCRVCGKDYDEANEDPDTEILDSLLGLGVDYTNVCQECCYTGHSKIAEYAAEFFKE